MKFKKSISFVLTLCMVLSLFATFVIPVAAEDVASQVVENWDVANWNDGVNTSNAAYIFTDAEIYSSATAFAWWRHVAFAPTATEGVYEVTEIAVGTGGGGGGLTVPENGFVWVAFEWPESGSGVYALNVMNAVEVGDSVKFTGVDFANKTAAADATAEKYVDPNAPVNVALGKEYDLSGCGNRASYYGDLTDGASVNALGSNNNVDWFGFYCNGDNMADINAPDKVGTVVIDLGAMYDISSMRTKTIAMPSWGIAAAGAINFYASADGVEYTLVGSGVVTADEGVGYWSGTECEVTAQYVKLEIELAGTFAFINEFEVYGVEATADDDVLTWEDGWVNDPADTNPNDGQNLKFDNAYGYTFVLDADKVIGGEDNVIITNVDDYNACNPNWAISVLLAPEGDLFKVVKTVATPGSAANAMAAGINFDNGNIVLVAHSSASHDAYPNWQAKLCALALKEGDLIRVSETEAYVLIPNVDEVPEAPVEEDDESYKDTYTYVDGVTNGTSQSRETGWESIPVVDFWYLVEDGESTVTVNVAVDNKKISVDDTMLRIWIDTDPSDTARTTLVDVKVKDGAAYVARCDGGYDAAVLSATYEVIGNDYFFVVELDKATLGIDGQYGLNIQLGQAGYNTLHSITWDAFDSSLVPWSTTAFYEIFGEEPEVPAPSYNEGWNAEFDENELKLFKDVALFGDGKWGTDADAFGHADVILVQNLVCKNPELYPELTLVYNAGTAIDVNNIKVGLYAETNSMIGFPSKDAKVYVSNDGIEWTLVESTNNIPESVFVQHHDPSNSLGTSIIDISFADTTAQYVKVVFTYTDSPFNDPNGDYKPVYEFIGFTEAEVSYVEPSAELPEDATVIDYLGYIHDAYSMVAYAEADMTLGELVAKYLGQSKDLNYCKVAICDGDGTVVAVYLTLGREPAEGPNGVKTNLTIAAGQFAVIYNANKAGHEVMDGIKVGDTITLYNVDALESHTGTAVALENAGFTVKAAASEDLNEVDGGELPSGRGFPVTVPANTALSYVANFANGADFILNDTSVAVLVNGVALEGEWGYEAKLVAGDVVTFVNTGAEEITVYPMVFPVVYGTMSNPIVLDELGDITANINEDIVMDGGAVHYLYTATANGTLTITMPEGNWTYTVNNLTAGLYGDSQWSDSDPVLSTYSIEVSAGDEIEIIVGTYNPESMWDIPVGELTFNAAFEAVKVTSNVVTDWNTSEWGGANEAHIFTNQEAYLACTHTWWSHVSFKPTSFEGVYEVVAIRGATGEAAAYEIAEGGFIWLAHDTAAEGTAGAYAHALIKTLAVGDLVKFTGIDVANCTTTEDATAEKWEAPKADDVVKLEVSHQNLYNWGTYQSMIICDPGKTVTDVISQTPYWWIMYVVEEVDGVYVATAYYKNCDEINTTVCPENGFLYYVYSANSAWAVADEGKLLGYVFNVGDIVLGDKFAIDTSKDTPYTVVALNPEAIKAGDVNLNGEIDAADYAIVRKLVLGTLTAEDIGELAYGAADVNGDGKVNARDYYLIKRAYLGTYVIPGWEVEDDAE